jgi:hypothetical protein
MKKIKHVFTQAYTNWHEGTVFDQFNSNHSTTDIIMSMDLMEAAVYRDRDFLMAHEMLSAIGIIDNTQRTTK